MAALKISGLIFENSVGVFFFGGADIPPSVYGGENLYSSTTDPGRALFRESASSFISLEEAGILLLPLFSRKTRITW
ncbi:MAG: gamma-glutamyl-gamma-aminobutyrate hydrolase family protein [Marinilabiliales bacterium]|nr:gamma-glutamyl-gamma-aminobutyrate hydrolase family protein [Marinilabiliales bacterium]